MDNAELVWKLFCELRAELREAQKIRAQVIGFKITFVTAAFGLIFGMDTPEYRLLIVPAFASIFFDYLIVSYSFSIKRIGYYCRNYLEPKLREEVSWPSEHPLWEEAMGLKEMRQHFSRAGNLGITSVAVFSSAAFVVSPNIEPPEILFLALLFCAFVADLYFNYWFKYLPTGRLNWHPLKEEPGNDDA